jgi:hypothetical protein
VIVCYDNFHELSYVTTIFTSDRVLRKFSRVIVRYDNFHELSYVTDNFYEWSHVTKRLTIEQISNLVEVNFEVGNFDVEFEILLHRVDVVEDVVDDARDDAWKKVGPF